MQQTRIAFIDDHPTLLAGMAAIFSSQPAYEIVGTGKSADEALGIADRASPEVMIFDLSMPGDVYSAIADVTQRTPQIHVIVFSAFANVDMALRALDAGAQGFVLKGRPTTELFTAIEQVRQGELFVSPDFAPKLESGVRNRPRPAASFEHLSARELQIVEGLLQGKSNKEIARDLDLAEKTVKHYMTNLMTKLGVRNRLEVVLAAQSLRPDALPPEVPVPAPAAPTEQPPRLY
ncbi:MAG TPA: response regulator transcription factor [Devosia sp.]